ncbi:MAG: hypothetical protein GY737_21835, partial [Desulfobacteraceae bacterium]|nr:hypothetical protein [Desulfobacteraceae bacterium]
MKFLMSSLEGAAFQAVYTQRTANAQFTFLEAKTLLEQRFSVAKNPDVAYMQLHTAHWNPKSESIEDFGSKLLISASRALGPNIPQAAIETLAARQFKRVMPQQWLHSLSELGTDNFNDLLNLAAQLFERDKAFNQQNALTPGFRVVNPSQVQSGSFGQRPFRGGTSNSNFQSPVGGSSDSSSASSFRNRLPPKCFNCSVVGHSVRQCPSPVDSARIERNRIQMLGQFHPTVQQNQSGSSSSGTQNTPTRGRGSFRGSFRGSRHSAAVASHDFSTSLPPPSLSNQYNPSSECSGLSSLAPASSVSFVAGISVDSSARSSSTGKLVVSKVRILGVEFSAVIDSAAVASLINAWALDQLINAGHLELLKQKKEASKLKLHAADGRDFSPETQFSLPIELGEQRRRTADVIFQCQSSATFPILLGTNAFEAFGFELSFPGTDLSYSLPPSNPAAWLPVARPSAPSVDSSSVMAPPTSPPSGLQFVECSEVKPACVVLDKNAFLLGRHASICLARVDTPVKIEHGSSFLFSTSKFDDSSSVSAVNALVTPDDQGRFRIEMQNHASLGERFSKGTVVGTLEPVEVLSSEDVRSLPVASVVPSSSTAHTSDQMKTVRGLIQIGSSAT